MDDLKIASIENKPKESITKADPKIAINDLEAASNSKTENINLTNPKNLLNEDLNIDVETGFQSRFDFYSLYFPCKQN